MSWRTKRKKDQLRSSFEFKAFGLKQRRVLNWWTDNSPVKDMSGVIADGAIRSGKTISMSLSFVIWAMDKYHDNNFAMCGKTIQSFHRNVFGSLSAMITTLGYKLDWHRTENMFEVTLHTKTWVHKNRFYIFGGKDERSQDLIQGITLAGVFFDEVALMPQSFVNQATGRCSVDGSKFWFNCNPEGPSHWFRQEWVLKAREKKLLYLHFVMDDNLTLSTEIKDRYKSMYSGVFYQRYILGLWVLAEGLVYPMFDPKKHVIHIETKGEKRWQYDHRKRYFISIDYGTVNPFAALLIEYDPKSKVSILLDEVYYRGRDGTRVDNEAYYKMIADMAGPVPIESIVIDPSAAGMIETIKKYHKYHVRTANNDVLDGIVEVTKYLNKKLFLVADWCRDTIDEFQTYAWDDDPLVERVIKENDHAMDAMRYYIMTIMKLYNRWEV